MNKVHQDPGYREGYPEEFASAEEKLLKISRRARNKSQEFTIRECTGVGLSGGGIRSATFCLGAFQGLATLKLLANIDFISTVSGGGYFGSFYTRFFLRKEVPDFKYVEETLAPCTPPEKSGKDHYQRNILTWLRENGRYLSPTGSGDLLLAGTVLLRNWMVVQVILATFFLLLFLTAHLLRIPMDRWFRGVGVIKEFGAEMVLNLPGSLQLWVTPFVALPVLLFIFGALPLGWAYWMVGRQPPKTQFWKRPVSGLIFVVLAAFTVLMLPERPGSGTQRAVAFAMLILSALTAFWVCVSEAYSKRSAEAEDPATGLKYCEAFKDNLSRHLISAQLKGALLITLAALAFVAIDSLGQTVYLVLLTPGASLKSWAGGLLGALMALVPFATKIMISLHGADGGNRPKTLTKVAAAAAALLITVTLLTTFSVAANALAWSAQRPRYAPADIGKPPLAKLSETEIVHDSKQPNNWSIRGEQSQPEPETAAARDEALLWGAWGIALVLSFLLGQSWPFLNRSTQLPLYSARLTRAYLGASNPRRFQEDGPGQTGGAVTRVIPGDDIDIDYYWPWPAPYEETRAELEKAKAEIYQKGTPLHLVNVTINETLDSKSQVQQQDRKGIGMALGPAGISAGIHHHVVFEKGSQQMKTFPAQGFRMFDYGEHPGHAAAREFKGERLPLGQWLGISGAAFSTGLGARTNLALSLLTGFGNIRLGYWWNSGIVPRKRPHRQKRLFSQWLGSLFTYLFPVQSYLLDEYTARYHGTARKYWNLSDGGHFENMGGYELIRRRLRLIIIVDAEADPDYTFGGLAELIRKARIDFGADIRFLDESEIGDLMPDRFKHCFSALENLRRGKWVEESLPLLKREGKRQTIDPVDYQRHSLGHAALARVSYDCRQKAESCLIYLKPTIVGDEPLDVLQYHVENPSFPQQTTADQFFDESQWESYRALGEHIASHVFKAPEGKDQASWWESLIEKVLQGPADSARVREEGP
ncbi:MAG: hypothetical protein A2075_14405 [Geobacteraceae bacterium GWC2_58_44]|nr:MAG: hypothetical protein A2075_14405 [Geobacteraceae bacterium GWC2_58_44]HBG07121.1 hypothetical protein [Geobacter sp.]